MSHVKTPFVKQYLKDKMMPLNSLCENYTRKLSTNSTDIICSLLLYYLLSTLWDFLYCCLKLQDSETLLCTSLSNCCSSLLPFVLALNLQIWLCTYCSNWGFFACIMLVGYQLKSLHLLFWGTTFSTLGKLYKQLTLLNNSVKNKIKPTKKWFPYTAAHVMM